MNNYVTITYLLAVADSLKNFGGAKLNLSELIFDSIIEYYTVHIRGRKPGPSPKPARAGPGFGPKYVGPGRASGLSTSARAGPRA